MLSSGRFVPLVATLVASMFLSAPASAQRKPFPTSGHYAQGYVPSSATAAAALSSYSNWKTTYLLSDCGSGYYRVDNANGDASTFSEGQGYGMVLTAYFGDKTQFDGLWAFAQKNFNASNLMGWHVNCGGFTTSDGGNGSATDGDTDIGFGLLIAAVQWGGTYLQQAVAYLATLKTGDFTTCSPSGRNMPIAGNWQMGSTDPCTTAGGGSNTSYWMPGYYRVFQAVTGDAFWGKAADDVVALYNLSADPTTGIIVNEVDQDGVAVSGQTYDYNSCRIPWRAVLDYLWFGTAGAAQATTKITNWANTVGIANIVDGYNANGTATGQYTGLNEWVGGFAAGAMSNSQSLVESFAADFVGIADNNGTYYGSSLRTLYLLELSGNQWNPTEELSDAGTSTGGSDSGATSGGADSGTAPEGTDAGIKSGGLDSGTTIGASDSGTIPSTEADGAPTRPDGGASSSSGCGCRLGRSGPSLGEGAGIASILVPVGARRRRRRAGTTERGPA
jgi:endo-1,4-beta-D-glucanase Y